MKKLNTIQILIFALILFGTVSQVAAITLDFSQIKFDTKKYAAGVIDYEYDLTTKKGILRVETELKTILSTDNKKVPIEGTLSYSLRFLSDSIVPGIEEISFPGKTIGQFGSFEESIPDFQIIDANSTLLLEGNIVSVTLSGNTGDDEGESTTTFFVTGGSLGSLFTSQCESTNCWGTMHTLYKLSMPFHPGMFENNFSGHIRDQVAPVPEPGTILLLGISILGTVFFQKRKKI